MLGYDEAASRVRAIYSRIAHKAGRTTKAEDKGKREERRGQREEGRGQREENGREIGPFFLVFLILFLLHSVLFPLPSSLPPSRTALL